MNHIVRILTLVLALSLALAGCGGSPGEAPATQVRTMSGQAASVSAGVTADSYDAEVQKLYVGYFGRPADAGGLVYFKNLLAGAKAPTDVLALARAYDTDPTVRAIVEVFSESQESKELYSGDEAAFVNAIYRNLYNRDAEPAGKKFWSDLLVKKSITRANAALAILGSAQSGDITTIDNKVHVAQQFTSGLLTDAHKKAYSGAGANAVARTMLASVNAQTDRNSFVASSVRDTLGYLVANFGPLPTCAAPQFLQGRVCVSPPVCARNEALKNNACVAVCAPGSEMTAGVCRPIPYIATRLSTNGQTNVPTLGSPVAKILFYNMEGTEPREQLNPHITVSPAYTQAPGYWYTQTVCDTCLFDGRIRTIGIAGGSFGWGQLRPNTTYTVSVSADLANQYGVKLLHPATFTFTTAATCSVGVVKDGECVPPQCPAGYSLDQFHWTCIPPDPVCKSNQVLIDHQCFTIPPSSPGDDGPVGGGTVPSKPVTSGTTSGGGALACTRVTQVGRADGDVVTIHNICNYPIFVMYCGNLKYDKAKCGSTSVFFTHSFNMDPAIPSSMSNDIYLSKVQGYVTYGACPGKISFGSKGFSGSAGGRFSCK